MDKKRIQKRTCHPIEIPLLFRPRPYARGSGPMLAPLRITLTNDLAGYITEKTVLSTPTKDGEIKLQVHYIVRWTDLIAASLAVPATSILDYVSSRTLEDFEYKLSLEQDKMEEEEERRKKMKTARKRMVQPSTLPGTPGTRPATSRKRGRPSKVDLLMKQPAKSHMEDVSPLPPVATSYEPSLSTPQKSLGHIDGLITDDDLDDREEETEDVDLEDAIFEQLYGKNHGTSLEVDELDVQVPKLDYPSSSPVLKIKPFTAMNKPIDGTAAILSRPSSPANMSVSISPFTESESLSVSAASGFTSAGYNIGKPASSSCSHTPAEAKIATPHCPSDALMNSSRLKRKKKKFVGSASFQDKPMYEVKMVEGDKILDDDDGKRRRWYNVRWKGDWPADQNPTWEPEENLPRNLVQKYLKRKASGKLKSPLLYYNEGTRVAQSHSGESEGGTKLNTSRQNIEDEDGEGEILLVEEREKTPDAVGRVPIQRTERFNFATVRDLGSFKANGDGQHLQDPKQFQYGF